MGALNVIGEPRDGAELVAAADARSVRSLTGNPDDTRVIARFAWHRSVYTYVGAASGPSADDAAAWTAIPGATRPTYRCSAADVGRWLRATVVPLLKGAAASLTAADGTRPVLRATAGPVLDAYSDNPASLQWQLQPQPQLYPAHQAPQAPEQRVVVEGQYTAVSEGGNRLLVHLSPRQVLSSSRAGSPAAPSQQQQQPLAQRQEQQYSDRDGQQQQQAYREVQQQQQQQTYLGAQHQVPADVAIGVSNDFTTGYVTYTGELPPQQATQQEAWPEAFGAGSQPRHLHASVSLQPQRHQQYDGDGDGADGGRGASAGARQLHRYATSPDRSRQPGPWLAQDPYTHQQHSHSPVSSPKQGLQRFRAEEAQLRVQPEASVSPAASQSRQLHVSSSMPPPQHRHYDSGESAAAGGASTPSRQLYRFATSPDQSGAAGGLGPAQSAYAYQQHRAQTQAPSLQSQLMEQSQYPPLQFQAREPELRTQTEPVQQQQQQYHPHPQNHQPRHLHASTSLQPQRQQESQPQASSSPSRRLARSVTSPDRARSPGRWQQIMDPLLNPAANQPSANTTVPAGMPTSPGSFAEFLHSARNAGGSAAIARDGPVGGPIRAWAGGGGTSTVDRVGGTQGHGGGAADASYAQQPQQQAPFAYTGGGIAGPGLGLSTLREGAMDTPTVSAPLASAAGGGGGFGGGAASPLPAQRLEAAFQQHGPTYHDEAQHGTFGGGGGDDAAGAVGPGPDTLREALGQLLAQHQEAVQQVVLDHAVLQQQALLGAPLGAPPPPAPPLTYAPPSPPAQQQQQRGQREEQRQSQASWGAPRTSIASDASSVSLSLPGAQLQMPRGEGGSSTTSSSGGGGGMGVGGGGGGATTGELHAEYLTQVLRHAQLEKEAGLAAARTGEDVGIANRGGGNGRFGAAAQQIASAAGGGGVGPSANPLALLELLAEEAELHTVTQTTAAAAAMGRDGAGAGSHDGGGGDGSGGNVGGDGGGGDYRRSFNSPLAVMRGMNEALVAQLAESTRLQAHMQRALDAAMTQMASLQQQQREREQQERKEQQQQQEERRREQQQQQRPVSPPPRRLDQAAQTAASPPRAPPVPAAMSPRVASLAPAASAGPAGPGGMSATSVAGPERGGSAEASGAPAAAPSASGEAGGGGGGVTAGLEPAAAAALRTALLQQHQRWKKKKAKLKEQAQAWQYTAWRYATAWKQSREVVQALMAAQDGGGSQPLADAGSAMPRAASPPPAAALPSRHFRPLAPDSGTAAAAAAESVTAASDLQDLADSRPGGVAPPPFTPTGLAAGIAALLSRRGVPRSGAGGVGGDGGSGGVTHLDATAATAYTARVVRRAAATSTAAAVPAEGRVRGEGEWRGRRELNNAATASPNKPLLAVKPRRGTTPTHATGATPAMAAARRQVPTTDHLLGSGASVGANHIKERQTAVVVSGVGKAQGEAAEAGMQDTAGAVGVEAAAQLPDAGRPRDQAPSRGRSRSASRGREGDSSGGSGPVEAATHWPATLRATMGEGTRPRSPSPGTTRPPFKSAVAPSSPLGRKHHPSHQQYGAAVPLPQQLQPGTGSAYPANGRPPPLSYSNGQQPKPYRDPQGWWHYPDGWLDVYNRPPHVLQQLLQQQQAQALGQQRPHRYAGSAPAAF